ncbi:hypothetical protein LY76DRAFT_79569 [Colletotrichum caudatum]|nr:hypothetical protein LY76DRAFT_79569 [Colletotrichum caudatum]
MRKGTRAKFPPHIPGTRPNPLLSSLSRPKCLGAGCSGPGWVPVPSKRTRIGDGCWSSLAGPPWDVVTTKNTNFVLGRNCGCGHTSCWIRQELEPRRRLFRDRWRRLRSPVLFICHYDRCTALTLLQTLS